MNTYNITKLQPECMNITPLKYLQRTINNGEFLPCSHSYYHSNHTKMVFLILNKHIEKVNYDKSYKNLEFLNFLNNLKTLWERSCYVAITDGAIHIVDIFNKIYNSHSCSKLLVPNLIVGDFDSAKYETLIKYERLGAKLVRKDDQNETDFTKCLRVLGKELGGNISYLSNTNNPVINSKEHFEIIVLGGLNGRFDHIMASINTLHIVYNEWLPLAQTVNACYSFPPFIQLISNQSIAFLIAPKFNYLINANTGLEGGTCGIIPFLGKCHGITTTGLMWNLCSKDSYEFGHLISTSNKFVYNGTQNNTVSIHTSEVPVVFTLEIKANENLNVL